MGVKVSKAMFFSSVICTICENELKICIVCVFTCDVWVEWMEMTWLTRWSPKPALLRWATHYLMIAIVHFIMADYGHATKYALTVRIWADSDFK